MTKEQTVKFLGLVRIHFQNFQVSDEVVEAWHLMLKDVQADQVWNAYKAIMSEPRDFPPNVSQVLGEVKKAKSPAPAILVWADGARPNLASSEAKEAYRRWGGDRRYRYLPDPRYAPNQSEALRIISYARKEFLEIYETLVESRQRKGFFSQQSNPRLENSVLNRITEAA